MTHPDFLQVHPFLCFDFISLDNDDFSSFIILLSNAFGSLFLISYLEFSIWLVNYLRLWQQSHPQCGPQNMPLAKHSQYSFKHLDLVQLHLETISNYLSYLVGIFWLGQIFSFPYFWSRLRDYWLWSDYFIGWIITWSMMFWTLS